MVMATPAAFVGFSRQQGLAADGRCKAFSAAADGMGIAEGAGLVLVERLSDARRLGHRVLAVVAGSAVNQDGASNGLTAPNGPSQQRVIRAALASARISADQVDAVEAHGTGTTLGDPIEAQALLATYGQGRPEDHPLWLGSVKSNVGHAQAAAGAAGVIKMVLALQHQMLPRTLHAAEPSPHVDWSAGAVRLLAEPVPWPAGGQPRRAGVSAFGMSGTNVHAILEEPPAEDRLSGEEEGADRELQVPVHGVIPWVVSGRSAEGLRTQARRLAAYLTSRPDLDPADVAWSLAMTRSVFEHRAVAIGASRQELAAGMAALAAGEPAAGVVEEVAGDAGKVVFVFPGQGSQWAGMGRELAESSPVFAARLAECGRALAPWVDWSLEEVFAGADGAPGLDRAEVVQPVLWAVMVSLAALWQSAGIVPDAVLGHSQGEIAAACVAGVLSLEDAAQVVAVRSQALSGLAAEGGMVSVVMRVAGVRELMAPWRDRLWVAAVNGPAATVVSGELAALAEFEADLSARRVMRWRIPETDFVAHSAGVEDLAGPLAESLAALRPVAGRVPLYSSALCRWMDGPELDAGYWYANLRETVRFDEAVRALAEAGHRTFIEVSPHPVLEAGIADTIDESGVAGVPVISGTLHRESSGARQFLTVLGRLHARGIRVDWAAVVGAGQQVELPTYAFQRQHYWPPASRALAPAVVGGDGAGAVAEARFWAAVEGGDLQALVTALAVDRQQPFSEVLPALSSWRRRERDRSVTGSWRYRIGWAPVADSWSADLSGTWLVVVPDGQAGAALPAGCVRALAARGAEVIVTEAAAGADRAVLAARIGQALATRVSEVAGVVSLLALEQAPAPGYPVVPGGLALTLALVQALGDAGVGAPLWVLTCGAVAVATDEVLASAVQAQAWGLGRVVGVEHPDRWGGLVDLPSDLDERAAARLCGVLAGCGEDQVAIRTAGVMARRLMRASLPREAQGRWAPRGTVLITGGTGAVGGHVARWLAGRGAPRMVLASRSGPAVFGVAGLAAQLAASGTRVTVVACDIAQREAVAGLLNWIDTSGAPLAAVMHTAGVLDDGVLDGLSTARLETTLAAKAAGAVHLDELTSGLDLDAFVLFSSAAATFGAAGQGNYAAANAFLDALAQQRAARGQAAVSVAWGPWAGGGVAQASEAVRHRLRRGPLPEMSPDLAVKALGQAVGGADSLLAVMDVDWALFMSAPGADRVPFLRDLPDVRQLARDASAGAEPGTVDGGPGFEGELAQQLAGTPPAEQIRMLTDLVRTAAAAVLGHASAEAIEAGRAFSELGFDSLTALEMRQYMTAVSGLRLPATLLFDYPAPTVLAEHLRAELVGAPAADAASPAPAAAQAVDEDPIAIVAMSCRFPGGVRDPEGLWELVAGGRDGISAFPSDRGWDVEGLYDPDPGHEGTSYVREGGFVHEAAEFDPGFFGISPREALAMDPQQRLVLEVSWEAVERAGIDPASLRGSQTGVFVGGYSSGYGIGVQLALKGTGGLEGHLLTGNASSVISGRVAYTLGLEGPAVTVDTACSSSLVTLHLACQALRSGECTMALAGGVTIMATPGDLVGFSRQRGLAENGRCKAFSASADGMGMAEGVGMLVLERLSDAHRRGHRVLAVVRGSAVNQDGASNGLTAPNGPSQQRVIRAALASAQLTADQVDAVEGHGTGTELGDPIEAQALLATYGQGRDADRPLWLGSVKSNIGHAQAAAGVAGLIKMVLALQHQLLPPTLHADEPSPHVDWSAGAVRLLTEPVPWPANGRPRRAGVSAFGISGTNAHAILEQAPGEGPAGDAGGRDVPEPAVPVVTSGLVPWLVSGRTEEGLRAQAGRLAAYVAAHPELNPLDMGWSLATSRAVFEHRMVVTGADQEELAAGLAAAASGRPAAGVVSGLAADPGRVVFVFPGQGGQWAGMGRELAACSPVFAARLAECGQALAPWVDWSLEEILARADGAPELERADVVQPVLWAVMVSMAALWQAAGVAPDAVVGHSQGEIAAACVAGVLSLDDAAKVVALRSQALAALAGHGGMLSVAERAAQLRQRIEPWGDRLAVAAVNGPAATVVSGEPAALGELAAACEAAGIRVKPVPVDYASHSAQVERIREEILAVLAGIRPGPAQLPMISAMTGEFLDGPEAGAQYWFASLRAPVEFHRAVRVLAGAGHQVFIEISPHPVLTAAITETLEEAAGTSARSAPATVTGTLRRHDGGARRFLSSLAEVHVRGIAVNWTRLLAGGHRVDLPTYAFQHQRYWPRPAPVPAVLAAALGVGSAEHPLLGAAVELAAGEGLVFTGRLSLQEQPWLADHVVAGDVLLPGTAFVELAVRAGDLAGCARVEELALEAPLVLPRHGAVQLQVIVSGPDQGGRRTIEVYARSESNAAEGVWTRHGSGSLAPAGPARRSRRDG